MSDQNKLVLFQTVDEQIKLDVSVDGETVWLNRLQMAALFERDVKTIGKHINNAICEELNDNSVVAKFATTATDGKTYQVEHYNLDVIKNLNPAESSYDGWLDKYSLELLDSRQLIVELGCGWGDDTGYLVKMPAWLLSCDFSGEAIEKICKYYPLVNTFQFDMTEGFPFEAEAVDVIIADLCLHYFDDEEMGDIVAEIERVLVQGGRLICRVNSDKDMNHGAGQGEEIQRGLFLKDGVKKRFFDEELIRVCFEGMEIGTRARIGTGLEIGGLREYVCTKYPKEKVVWEFECQRS